MKKFLRQDHIGFGALLGLILPVLSFGIVKAIDRGVVAWKNIPFLLPDATIMVIAVAVNLIIFRIYMVNMRLDKTGRGILLATFIYAILYVVLFFLLDVKKLF